MRGYVIFQQVCRQTFKITAIGQEVVRVWVRGSSGEGAGCVSSQTCVQIHFAREVPRKERDRRAALTLSSTASPWELG